MIFCQEPIPDSKTHKKRSNRGRQRLANANVSIIRPLNDDRFVPRTAQRQRCCCTGRATSQNRDVNVMGCVPSRGTWSLS
jgi:hypothetical protein